MPKKTEYDRRMYPIRVMAQTLSWAMGVPEHNYRDDECCPDFSCCQPDLFEKDGRKRWAEYRAILAKALINAP